MRGRTATRRSLLRGGVLSIGALALGGAAAPAVATKKSPKQRVEFRFVATPEGQALGLKGKGCGETWPRKGRERARAWVQSRVLGDGAQFEVRFRHTRMPDTDQFLGNITLLPGEEAGESEGRLELRNWGGVCTAPPAGAIPAGDIISFSVRDAAGTVLLNSVPFQRLFGRSRRLADVPKVV